MLGLDVAERAQQLNDVELALLLSLVAKEHCLIRLDRNDHNLSNEKLHLVRTD